MKIAVYIVIGETLDARTATKRYPWLPPCDSDDVQADSLLRWVYLL